MQEGMERLASALIRTGFDWLLTVPTSGVQPIYRAFEERGRCLYATREEEAVAIAAGMALGRKQPLVLMQQSGVGNCLNAMFSLADACEIYFPIVVVERAGLDPNPIQRVSAAATRRVLDTLGCEILDWEHGRAQQQLEDLTRRRRRWLIVPIRAEH